MIPIWPNRKVPSLVGQATTQTEQSTHQDPEATITGKRFHMPEAQGVTVESEKPARGDEHTQPLPGTQQPDHHTSSNFLNDVRLTEVTSKIFDPIQKGEICRYGNTGWIMRCPDCGRLMILENDTHQTYIDRGNSIYRLSPSLVCPHDGCKWHVFAIIKPETVNTEEPNTKTESLPGLPALPDDDVGIITGDSCD